MERNIQREWKWEEGKIDGGGGGGGGAEKKGEGGVERSRWRGQAERKD